MKLAVVELHRVVVEEDQGCTESITYPVFELVKGRHDEVALPGVPVSDQRHRPALVLSEQLRQPTVTPRTHRSRGGPTLAQHRAPQPRLVRNSRR
jgi:hypothetical protein